MVMSFLVVKLEFNIKKIIQENFKQEKMIGRILVKDKIVIEEGKILLINIKNTQGKAQGNLIMKIRKNV